MCATIQKRSCLDGNGGFSPCFRGGDAYEETSRHWSNLLYIVALCERHNAFLVIKPGKEQTAYLSHR